jgi:4'-phosphopantetheinyl transferase
MDEHAPVAGLSVHPLESAEVHVWRAPLDRLVGDVPRLHALLSADEQARCRRFVRESDRIRFGLTRGILRMVLSRYCGVPAAALAFTYSAYGKPALAADATDLQFNVSHSDGMAVYAIARGRPVGIDVERIRDLRERDEIVSRHFSCEEVAAYRALPVAERQRAFFNGWTRKEAFVKALGEGLHQPLSGFAVSLSPGEPARLLRTPAGSVHDWTLWDLTEDSSYVVALAAAGTGLRFRCQQWLG